MRPGKTRPGMTDVARLAGVSHQTVWRVLHDSPKVLKPTRARVLAAMRRLDYRLNATAQALVTGRSRVVGVVSLDTALYGPTATLLGIERAAADAGYGISIATLHALTRGALLEAIHRLRDQGIGGILIVAPPGATSDALRKLPAGIPVVVVGAVRQGSIPAVTFDQIAGAAAATRHLLDLGHEAIAHIAGPAEWIESGQRMAGWRNTLVAAGAKVPPVLRGDWSARSGHELAGRLLDLSVTAAFVANDSMALGLLSALHERGRELPGHLSIVGFDDLPEATYFTPPLTTVRQDFAELGRRSLQRLLAEIQSAPGAPKRIVIPPELIVRGSTCRPRGARKQEPPATGRGLQGAGGDPYGT